MMHTQLTHLTAVGLCLLSIVACSPAYRDSPDDAGNSQSSASLCDLFIQDVNVVDVVNTTVRDHMDVCIKGSDIATVRAHLPGSSEHDVVISGAGRFLIPGLYDMHVHFRGGEESVSENRDLLPLYLAHGITGVYDMGSDIAPSLIEWRKAIDERELIGPDLFLTGPKVDGPEPWFAGSLVVETQADVVFALDQLAALGVDGVKIMGGTLSVDAFWHVLESSEDRGVQTIAHVPGTISAIEAAGNGLGAIAHLSAIVDDGSPSSEDIRTRLIESDISRLEAMDAFGATFDKRHMQAAIERLNRTNTALITTYYGNWLMADGISNESIDWEREHYPYVGPLTRESVETGFVNDQSFVQAHQASYQSRLDHVDWVLGKLADTEILVLIGTDSGPRNSVPGRVLHREMELLVSAGLSAAYVLRAATYNPAIFLGQASRSGVIDRGRVANLVLLGGNPLADIASIQRIEGVIKAGRYFPKSEIDAMLAALRQKYSN